jgi:hypothetical protein
MHLQRQIGDEDTFVDLRYADRWREFRAAEDSAPSPIDSITKSARDTMPRCLQCHLSPCHANSEMKFVSLKANEKDETPRDLDDLELACK